MIRRVVVGLLSVAFLIAGLAIAQEPPGGDDPPVRLKKKNKPDAVEKGKEDQPKPADPPKDEPKDKDPKDKDPKEGAEPAVPDEPEMDESEVLNRVGKNMRTSEDRLANRELTDGTRQVQDDILKDLDSLINQMKNGGGGADNQNQNEQQQAGDEQKQGGGKQNQGGKTKIGMGRKGGKGGQQQQAKAGQGKKPGSGQGQGAQGQQQANAGQGQKPQQTQGGANQGGGGGQSQPGDAMKLAELYKDRWGELPETMRAEMNAYSREQFMAKYNDLIKQYYSTVAEKSRRKE